MKGRAGRGVFLRAKVQGVRALEGLKQGESLICFNVMWRVDFNGTSEEGFQSGMHITHP